MCRNEWSYVLIHYSDKKVDFRPWKLALKTENNQSLAMINQKVLHDFDKNFGVVH